MTLSTTAPLGTERAADLSRRRLAIGFLNWAHALDHFVILIYPTVVIELQVVYGRSYATLIALATASFVAFGLFSLPAGWLGDRWSRRNLMVAFYVGCGVSLIGAAFAPSLTMLGVALFALGMFAAIYHPVGTAMILENATQRGRTLAFNGVCGNLGVARRLPGAGRGLHRHRRDLSLARSRRGQACRQAQRVGRCGAVARDRGD